MTDHLKEKYDNALDDIDHTFDADDRNAIVGQLITDVALSILGGAKTMSDVTEHLAFLVSRVRQCDQAFEAVKQGDDDTVLDMGRLSDAEVFKGRLEAVERIGKSHKSWRQMWESGKTLEEAVAVVVDRADRQTVRWEDV